MRAIDELMRLRDEEGGSEPLHRGLSRETQRDILRRYGVRPKRRFGQNFLIDPNAIEKVVDLAQIGPTDTVVEIGSGSGAITGKLADLAAAVHAVEVDTTLAAILKQEYSGRNVIVHTCDIRKFEFEKLAEIAGAPLMVVGNLPYYITTDIIFTLLANSRYITRCTLMVQKEYAQRLVATPGSKDYSALSVAVQFRAELEFLMSLEPGVFYPAPSISSSLIGLKPRRVPLARVPDDQLFQGIVRAAFATRRKTLLNALLEKSKKTRTEMADLLDAAEIEVNRRGETLSVEEFARLTGVLHQAGVVIRSAGKLN